MQDESPEQQDTPSAARKPWNTPRVIVSSAERTLKITNPLEYVSTGGSLFGPS